MNNKEKEYTEKLGSFMNQIIHCALSNNGKKQSVKGFEGYSFIASYKGITYTLKLYKDKDLVGVYSNEVLSRLAKEVLNVLDLKEDLLYGN